MMHCAEHRIVSMHSCVQGDKWDNHIAAFSSTRILGQNPWNILGMCDFLHDNDTYSEEQIIGATLSHFMYTNLCT